MRLLYVHLPRYLALRELHCPFRSTDLMPDRKGTLNFVVGLNGTGKSSLLRAIFQAFRRLSTLEPPRFAITLAYTVQLPPDLAPPSREGLVIVDKPRGESLSASLHFYTLIPGALAKLGNLSSEEWQAGLAELHADRRPDWPIVYKLIGAPLGELSGNALVQHALPRRILAYSSGSLLPWKRMLEPECESGDIEAAWSKDASRPGERPPGWSYDGKEPDAELSHRLLDSFYANVVPAMDKALGVGIEEGSDLLRTAQNAFERDATRAAEGGIPELPRALLLEAEDLPLVSVALGLWHSAVELRDRAGAAAMKALRDQLQAKPHSIKDGARRILRDLNWAWATHLSLRVNPEREPTDPDARSFLLALHGLSLTVARQPLERRRLVIPLGPRGDADPLGPMLERLGVTDPFARELAARADAAKTGADAVCRLFSPDGALWPLFERLRAWREMGWLEEATLTILRTNKLPNAAGNLDDSVLCLEDLSDGEQMLLARMGLLFLLRDQPNTLLLLDEPETHFNDVWKREIVDVVNHELLGDAEKPGTACQVIVSTHSSIALTDAFSPEVSQLKPEDGQTRVVSPQSPIFGAEAGEIMLNVFRAEDSIGEGAMKFLDAQLDHDWQPADAERLRALLANLGSSFHRAELRSVLKRLDAARP